MDKVVKLRHSIPVVKRIWFTRYPVADPGGWSLGVGLFGWLARVDHFGPKSGKAQRWQFRFTRAPYWAGYK